MDLAASILGRTVVNYIFSRQRAAVLTIGSDTFDRASLSAVACFNFTAAANLSKILNRELNVKNTRDVFERVHPDRLSLPRLGSVSLAVLGAAFQVKGIGGESPLANWYKKHDADPVTFATTKHRDAAERAAEKKATKQRRAARRDMAHRIRVDRFETKHGSVN